MAAPPPAAPAAVPAPAPVFVIQAANLEATNLYNELAHRGELSQWEVELVKRNINPDVYTSLIYYWKFGARDGATNNPVTDERIIQFNERFLNAPDAAARLALLRGTPDMYDEAVVVKAIEVAQRERGDASLRPTQRNTWHAEYAAMFGTELASLQLPSWAKQIKDVRPRDFDPLSSQIAIPTPVQGAPPGTPLFTESANPAFRAHYIKLYSPAAVYIPVVEQPILNSHIYLAAVQQVFASTMLRVTAPEAMIGDGSEDQEGLSQSSFVSGIRNSQAATPPNDIPKYTELMNRLNQLKLKLASARLDLARAGTNALPTVKVQRYLGTDVADFTGGAQVANLRYSELPSEAGEIELDQAADLLLSSWGNGFGNNFNSWPQTVRNDVRDLYIQRVKFALSSWLVEKLNHLSGVLDKLNLVAASAAPMGGVQANIDAWNRAQRDMDRMREYMSKKLMIDCETALNAASAHFFMYLDISRFPLSVQARNMLNRKYIQAYMDIYLANAAGIPPADVHRYREALYGRIVDDINTKNSWLISVKDWEDEVAETAGYFNTPAMLTNARDVAMSLRKRAMKYEKKAGETGVVYDFDETLHEIVADSLDISLTQILHPTTVPQEIRDEAIAELLISLLASVAVADSVKRTGVANVLIERRSALVGIDALYELLSGPTDREGYIMIAIGDGEEASIEAIQDKAVQLYGAPVGFTITSAEFRQAFNFVLINLVAPISRLSISLVRYGDPSDRIVSINEEEAIFLRHHGRLARESDFVDKSKLTSPQLAEKIFLYEIQETRHKITEQRTLMANIGPRAVTDALSDDKPVQNQQITIDRKVAKHKDITIRLLVGGLHPLLDFVELALKDVQTSETISEDEQDLVLAAAANDGERPKWVELEVTLPAPIRTSDLVLTTTALTAGGLRREAQNIQIRISVTTNCVRCGHTYVIPGKTSMVHVVPSKQECIWSANPLAIQKLQQLRATKDTYEDEFSLHEAILLWFVIRDNSIPQLAYDVLDKRNTGPLGDVDTPEAFAYLCYNHYPLPLLLRDLKKDFASRIVSLMNLLPAAPVTPIQDDIDAWNSAKVIKDLLAKHYAPVKHLCDELALQYASQREALALSMGVKITKLDHVATLARLLTQVRINVPAFDWDESGVVKKATKRVAKTKQAEEEILNTYIGSHSFENVLPDSVTIYVSNKFAERVIEHLQVVLGQPDLTFTDVFKETFVSQEKILVTKNFALTMGSNCMEYGKDLESISNAIKREAVELARITDDNPIPIDEFEHETVEILRGMDTLAHEYNEKLYGVQRTFLLAP